MYKSLKCVAFRTIRYDDRKSILTVWSDTEGRLSIALPAGDSREARRRRALTLPLSLFECECRFGGSGREIVSVRDVRPWHVAPSISAHPAKAAVALFLADVLDHVLRQSQPDPNLSAFLCRAVLALDAASHPAAVANFHLWFLYNLGRCLGIDPDTGEPASVFDLREGLYRHSAPPHSDYLEGREARMVALLARIRPEALHRLRLTRTERSRALDIILRYYTLHYVRLEGLNSLAVLRRTL